MNELIEKPGRSSVTFKRAGEETRFFIQMPDGARGGSPYVATERIGDVENLRRILRVFHLLGDIEYDYRSSSDLLFVMASWNNSLISQHEETLWKLELLDTHADVLRQFDPEVARSFVQALLEDVHPENYYSSWRFSDERSSSSEIRDPARKGVRDHVAHLIDILVDYFAELTSLGVDPRTLRWNVVIEHMRHTLSAGSYFRPGNRYWHEGFVERLLQDFDKWSGHFETAGLDPEYTTVCEEVRARLQRLLDSI